MPAKWEYRVEDLTFAGSERERLTTALNELGAQGWQLVSIHVLGRTAHGQVNWRAVLQRPTTYPADAMEPALWGARHPQPG